LPRDSIGYRLILKEGWKEGQGLGKFNQGPVVPFIPRYKNDRLGIGLVSKLHHFFKQPLHIRQQLLQQQRTGMQGNETPQKQKKQEDLEQHRAMQELERVLRQFKPENFALQMKLNQHNFNATVANSSSSSSNQISDFFSVLDELSRVSDKFDSTKREQAAANAANQAAEVPVYRIVDSVNGPVTVSTTLKPSPSSASTSKTPLIYTRKQKKLVTERDKLKAQLIRQEIYGR
jgi:hypothetical protein